MNYEDRVTKEYVEGALAGAGVRLLTGTYTGNGANSRTIDLGQPFGLLFVTNATCVNDGNYLGILPCEGSSYKGKGASTKIITHIGTGFQLSTTMLNEMNSLYHYYAVLP